jgi:hypothetical protein
MEVYVPSKHQVSSELHGVSFHKTCLHSLGTRDNIKMDLDYMGYEEVNFIRLDYDRVQWRINFNSVNHYILIKHMRRHLSTDLPTRFHV